MRNRAALLLFLFLSASLVVCFAGCDDGQSVKTESMATDKTKTADSKSPDAAKTGDINSKPQEAYDWKGLVTKEEAEGILGEPVAAAEYKDTGNPLGQKIIFWPVADQTKLNYVQLSLITTDGMKKQLRDAGQNAKKQFENEEAVLEKVESVTGIGDEAYWDGNSPLISGLHVLKGDYCFTVMINSKDKTTQLEAEKAQALKVLKRLP